MRRLQAPTLEQWGCGHRWKVTTSRPGMGDVLRIRYLMCRRCRLRVKSEERLTVPWGTRELLETVLALLPEEEPVYLRDQGISELPLYGLNTLLARQGYVIHAVKVRDAKRLVACTDKHGRVKDFGRFELRRIHQEAPGQTNGRRRRGR